MTVQINFKLKVMEQSLGTLPFGGILVHAIHSVMLATTVVPIAEFLWRL